MRNDAALRTFFLWLLDPDEARDQLEHERAYWARVLEELAAIEAEPPGVSRKERAFRLSLEGGLRTVAARIEWLDWAIGEVSSPAWRRS